MDLLDLTQVKLARQHDHIGEPRVEAQRLDIRDVELRGDVDLKPDLPAIGDRSHVGRDDGIHSGGLGGVKSLPHRSQILTVQDNIQSHVGLDTIFPTDLHYARQVVRSEIVRRMRAHVQVADTEIDGVRPALNRRVQAFEIARRGHYLKFLLVHSHQIINIIASFSAIFAKSTAPTLCRL